MIDVLRQEKIKHLNRIQKSKIWRKCKKSLKEIQENNDGWKQNCSRFEIGNRRNKTQIGNSGNEIFRNLNRDCRGKLQQNSRVGRENSVTEDMGR